MILDPSVDDIGLLVCCDRDISNVVATLTTALPASLRRFNFADGIYVGCSVSKTTPTQYVQFAPEGGGSDTHDLTTFPKLVGAIEAAERRAADFFDDDDFAVTVFVIDRDGVAVHRARGNAQQSDSGPEIRRIL